MISRWCFNHENCWNWLHSKTAAASTFINDLKKFFNLFFWMCHDEKVFFLQWIICALKLFIFWNNSWQHFYLLLSIFILRKKLLVERNEEISRKKWISKFLYRSDAIYQISLFTLQQTLTLWMSITSDLSCKKMMS